MHCSNGAAHLPADMSCADMSFGCRLRRRRQLPVFQTAGDEEIALAVPQFHTSWAVSTTRRNFEICSSSVSALPSWVDEKPHWGLRHSCSRGTNFAAASIRRLSSSLLSSPGRLEVTNPSTTNLPLGTKRKGSKPP